VQAQSSVAKPSEQRVVILNEFCTRPLGNETKRDLPDPVGIGRCSQSEQGVQPCVALALPRHKHASTNPRRGSFRGLRPSRTRPWPLAVIDHFANKTSAPQDRAGSETSRRQKHISKQKRGLRSSWWATISNCADKFGFKLAILIISYS